MWRTISRLKNVKDIKKGEQIFIYHTGDEKAAVGVAELWAAHIPTRAKKDPKLLVVDIEAVQAVGQAGDSRRSRKPIRSSKNFDLVRNSRLSIMKVTDEQWEIMEGMAKG